MTLLYSLRNKKGKILVQSVSEEYLKDLLFDDTLKQETELSIEHWKPLSSFSLDISESVLISLRSSNGQILLEHAHLQDVIACIEGQQHTSELEFCLEQWIPADLFSFETSTEKFPDQTKTASVAKKNGIKSITEKKSAEDDLHEKTIISHHISNIFTSSDTDEPQANEKPPEATMISQPAFFPQNLKEADTQKVKPKISFESLFDDDSENLPEENHPFSLPSEKKNTLSSVPLVKNTSGSQPEDNADPFAEEKPSNFLFHNSDSSSEGHDLLDRTRVGVIPLEQPLVNPIKTNVLKAEIKKNIPQPSFQKGTSTLSAATTESFESWLKELREKDPGQLFLVSENTGDEQITKEFQNIIQKLERKKQLSASDMSLHNAIQETQLLVTQWFNELKDPLIRKMYLRAKSMGLDYRVPDVKSYLTTQIHIEEGEKYDRQGDTKKAFEIFEKLANLRPDIPEHHSYLAQAMFKQAKGDKTQLKKAISIAEKACEMNEKSVTTQLILAKLYRENDDFEKAKRCLDAILYLNPNVPGYQEELRLLQEKQGKPPSSRNQAQSKTPLSSTASKNIKHPQKPISKGAKIPKKFDGQSAGIIFLAVIILISAAGLTSFGADEHHYRIDDPSFYLRRFLLIGGALFGLKQFYKIPISQIFQEMMGKLSLPHLGMALAIGCISGYFSPLQNVEKNTANVMLLTGIHVISEELFFRAYVTQVIQEYLGTFQAIVVSGIIFGLYHLSFFSFWESGLLYMIPKDVGMIIIGAGIPLAALMIFSKSIFPSIIAHFLMNGIMMFRSLL